MLMRSVSGVRGVVGLDLTPDIAARHAAAFGAVLGGGQVVVASDTRPTGPIIKEAAIAGLRAVGCDVVDIGVAPTPTVTLAVTHFRASGGVAVTASHNPIEWNALKFLGSSQQALPPRLLDKVYGLADSGLIRYRRWDQIGRRRSSDEMLRVHIERVLALKVVDVPAVRRRRPRVVFDAGGGAGSVYGPALLERLGCRVHPVHCTPGPRFPRGPEPVPKNLRDLCRLSMNAGTRWARNARWSSRCTGFCRRDRGRWW
jgi:phosphomannomutase